MGRRYLLIPYASKEARKHRRAVACRGRGWRRGGARRGVADMRGTRGQSSRGAYLPRQTNHAHDATTMRYYPPLARTLKLQNETLVVRFIVHVMLYTHVLLDPRLPAPPTPAPALPLRPLHSNMAIRYPRTTLSFSTGSASIPSPFRSKSKRLTVALAHRISPKTQNIQRNGPER